MRCRTLLCLLVLVGLAGVLAGGEPWPSQYLIRPWEVDRLRDGDVVGPDGIVYPDWRRAGVAGGIPDLAQPGVAEAYRTFPVAAGSGEDALAAAITAAVAHAVGGGRSIVRLDAGTWTISKPLPVISTSHVIVAGAGRAATILELVPGDGIKDGAAALGIRGGGYRVGPYKEVAGPVLRGARAIAADSAGLQVGDAVILLTNMREPLAPDATMRRRYDWPASGVAYTNLANGHFGRGNLARISALEEGGRVTLDRPIAHDLYPEEHIQLRRYAMVTGCGVQDLTIRTTAKAVRLDPIELSHASDSWLLRVTIDSARNWPVTGDGRLQCEIRDCDFLGTWEDINRGSVAYLGWCGNMVDCLMADCRAQDLRHMAIFQGAIRSVIRDCQLTGNSITSPQLHGQMPTDNLIEGCTFDNGSHTAYAVDGMSSLRHGIEGPRMVLYRNRFLRGSGSMVLNGGVEGHLILYNEVARTVGRTQLPALLIFDRSWNGILRGNAFQADPVLPFINVNDTSCPGWEVRDNAVHGSNGILAMGDSPPAIAFDNRRLATDAPLVRPVPEAESMVDWQRQHAAEPRLVLNLLGPARLAPGEATRLRLTRVQADAIAMLRVDLRCEPEQSLLMDASVTIPAGAVYVDLALRAGQARGPARLFAVAAGCAADVERLEIRDGDDGFPPIADRREGLPEGWALVDFAAGARTSAAWDAQAGRLTLVGGGQPVIRDSTWRIQGRTQTWQTLIGDGSLCVRIDELSAHGQAGLILCDDVAPITEHLIVCSDGSVIGSGAGQGNAVPGSLRAGDGGQAPVWLRLTRSGSILTAERSREAEPTTWELLVRVDVYADPPREGHYRSAAKLDDRMHLGVMLNNRSGKEPARAVFSRLLTTGNFSR
ncbi:MAG TPA: hypothetical protein DCS97_11365 [Planctomycetes bacterium]|nr:hypothetical protein [Planctomycetota bacterium]